MSLATLHYVKRIGHRYGHRGHSVHPFMLSFSGSVEDKQTTYTVLGDMEILGYQLNCQEIYFLNVY